MIKFIISFPNILNFGTSGNLLIIILWMKTSVNLGLVTYFSSFFVFLVIMGGSIFFFVESKTFEFSVEEGGTFYVLRIFERNKDSLRLVFMGKLSAIHLLTYVEDLMSNTLP